MLAINPANAKWGDYKVANVSSVVIERRTARLIAEPDEGTIHPVFIDVPEVRVWATLTHTVDPEVDASGEGFILGEISTLRFRIAVMGSDAQWRQVIMSGMLTGLRYRLGTDGRYQRVLTILGWSIDGYQDPVIILPSNSDLSPI